MSLQIGSPPKRFQSTWDTTQAGSSNNQVVLPLVSHGSASYNFQVDWGDGTSNRDTITAYNQAEVTHTYDSTGIYEIRIIGEIKGWKFEDGGDDDKIIGISKWGPLNLMNDHSVFRGCSNLIVSVDADEELLLNAGIHSANSTFSQCINLGGPTNVRLGPNATNADSMFNNCRYWDEDLSNFDMSNVTSCGNMFSSARNFNNGGSTGINNWDMGNVTSMSRMFQVASGFNQPIGDWDTSSVTNIYRMFYGDGTTISFNQPIGGWDVSNVTNMTNSFGFCKFFNQDIGSWDTSGVTTFQGMFYFCTGFNNGGSDSITGWNTSNATSFNSMFSLCRNFNHPLGAWNTSKVTDMSRMFNGASAFNQDLSNWDTSGVTDMSYMFYASGFNNGGQTGINNWDTSSCTSMTHTFGNCIFNQPIGNWDVSKVTNMYRMFFDDGRGGLFNQDISNWDVGKVTNMRDMFSRCDLFNQPIGSWNMSSVTTIGGMLFAASAFDQDLSNWIVTGVTYATHFMNATNMSTANYDRILSGWSPQSVQNGVNIHFGSANYSTATGAAYRATLVSKGWTITDGGAV